MRRKMGEKYGITLHYIKEDLQNFEEAERDSKEKLPMLSRNGKEVEQLTEDREIIGESLVSLMQYQ